MEILCPGSSKVFKVDLVAIDEDLLPLMEKGNDSDENEYQVFQTLLGERVFRKEQTGTFNRENQYISLEITVQHVTEITQPNPKQMNFLRPGLSNREE